MKVLKGAKNLQINLETNLQGNFFYKQLYWLLLGFWVIIVRTGGGGRIEPAEVRLRACSISIASYSTYYYTSTQLGVCTVQKN
jgi:hypothetical protein